MAPLGAIEEGNWEDAVGYAKKLNAPLSHVNRAYNEALLWAREVTARR
ncbi:MAG TPA: hypothetical protein VJQ59_12745 [Candidatus Sulfotelmatobacter sp.]|nr:hypothetical protein [Candidatus Sulfotelmatobacter sp.]